MHDDKVLELMRGIRLHFESFVKDIKEGTLKPYQLGLAHSYSRAKVKFNVNRADNMIIQSIALLDKMDKDINTFAMRVRYGIHWIRFSIWLSYFMQRVVFVAFPRAGQDRCRPSDVCSRRALHRRQVAA
jgi:hypothetical protein